MTIEVLTDDDLALIARRLDEPGHDTYLAAFGASHMRSLIKEVQQHRALAVAEQAIPKCSAHGEVACELCSLNPGGCQCDVYSETGMHWDTCPGRARGHADAMAYFAGKLAEQDRRQRAELSHFRLAAAKAKYEREKQP